MPHDVGDQKHLAGQIELATAHPQIRRAMSQHAQCGRLIGAPSPTRLIVRWESMVTTLPKIDTETITGQRSAEAKKADTDE